VRLCPAERADAFPVIVVALAGITVLLLVAARFLPVLDLAPQCVFRAVTGVPCPTCGSTHAFVHLSRGEIGAALKANPLMTVSVLSGALYTTYLLFCSVAGILRLRVTLSRSESLLLRVLIVLLLLSNWFYLIRAARGHGQS
jgi:hypothetical protein